MSEGVDFGAGEVVPVVWGGRIRDIFEAGDESGFAGEGDADLEGDCFARGRSAEDAPTLRCESGCFDL